MSSEPPEIDLDPVFRAIAWMSGRLEWKLHDAQRIIDTALAGLPAHVKEAVVLCCRRFGKSFYGCLRATYKGIQQPGRITRIIGPEIKQTRGIVRYNMAKICQELPALGLRDLVRWVGYENMYEINGPHGRSHIFLGGYDSEEDNQRGGEAHEILIEETGSSDPEQYDYQMRDVLKPQLLKTRGRLIHLTTLPPVPDHPFVNETIPAAKLDNAFYSYTIYEDPLATPEIIADAIKDCGGENSDSFRREYKNEQVRDRNLVVIPNYDDACVVAFALPLAIKLQVFMDWGGVKDKTVALLCGYDYYQNLDLYIDELVWDPNTATSKIVGELKPWMAEWEKEHAITEVKMDAPGQLLVDLRTDYELDVSLPLKDEWKTMVNQLNVRHAGGRVRIHPRCKFLQLSCRSGRLNDQKTDFARTKTLGHMDAVAAKMYANKGMDRESPYPAQVWSRDDQFQMPRVDQNPGIVPRSFGSPGLKKFGAFKG